jgi:hypothetical protein
VLLLVLEVERKSQVLLLVPDVEAERKRQIQPIFKSIENHINELRPLKII